MYYKNHPSWSHDWKQALNLKLIPESKLECKRSSPALCMSSSNLFSNHMDGGPGALAWMMQTSAEAKPFTDRGEIGDKIFKGTGKPDSTLFHLWASHPNAHFLPVFIPCSVPARAIEEGISGWAIISTFCYPVRLESRCFASLLFQKALILPLLIPIIYQDLLRSLKVWSVTPEGQE